MFPGVGATTFTVGAVLSETEKVKFPGAKMLAVTPSETRQFHLYPIPIGTFVILKVVELKVVVAALVWFAIKLPVIFVNNVALTKPLSSVELHTNVILLLPLKFVLFAGLDKVTVGALS